MSDTGYLNVHAFTSNAQIPLKNVAVAITEQGDDAIALLLTNSSGRLEQSIELEVPSRAESQQPNNNQIPYKIVNIYARKEDYQEIYIKNVQVFANTVTLQDLELIPLSEFPSERFKSEDFDTLTQRL